MRPPIHTMVDNDPAEQDLGEQRREGIASGRGAGHAVHDVGREEHREDGAQSGPSALGGGEGQRQEEETEGHQQPWSSARRWPPGDESAHRDDATA